MGLLEEIQRMRMSGMDEAEIISKLQEQGNPYRAISEAISQSKIKEAVEGPGDENVPALTPIGENPAEQNMQPSMLQSGQAPSAEQGGEYFQGYGGQQQSSEYQSPAGYDYSGGGLSSDTITELTEQVVSEKLSDVRKKIEKITIFKTEFETKAEALEERLKRIEKIIDALQTSVLRKVGDYVANVEDLKTEMIETQKTFAKVLGSKHKGEHKK